MKNKTGRSFAFTFFSLATIRSILEREDEISVEMRISFQISESLDIPFTRVSLSDEK